MTTTEPAPTNPTGKPSTGLTDREQAIVELVAAGRSNSEIGRALFLSEDTIKTHLRKTFRKLGARDRAHAVHLHHQAGRLAGPPPMSRGQLNTVILRWEGLVPAALIGELRAVLQGGERS